MYSARCKQLEKSRLCVKRVQCIAPQKNADAITFLYTYRTCTVRYLPSLYRTSQPQIYNESKIILLKEDGDTSHVCQAYDQDVAIKDKITMRSCLDYLRQSEKLQKNVIDGWDLIHVGLAAVRELDPKSWITSFTRVNLHPRHRVEFPQWIERIEQFLQGGLSFKQEEMDVDPYALLPSFWHGMSTVEKKQALTILQSHEEYTVECIRQLNSEMNIPLAEMQQLRVCLELALEHPDHLERSGKVESTGAPLPAEITSAQQGLADVAVGLNTFLLHPKRKDQTPMSNEEHFEHLVKMARRTTPAGTSLLPSSHLGVEYTPTQQMLLNPTAQDFTMAEIMSHAHGDGAQQALAKRKLDSLGNLRGLCGFANDEERMRRLKAQAQLASSLAEISKINTEEKNLQNAQKTTKLIDLAQSALKKLEENTNIVEKLTKSEIRSIAFVSFGGVILKESDPKPDLVRQLTELMSKQPSIAGIAGVVTSEAQVVLQEKAPRRRQKRAPRRRQEKAPRRRQEESDSAEELEEESDSEESEEEPSTTVGAVLVHTDSSDDEPPCKRHNIQIGIVVHVPHSAFPEEDMPTLGYWLGKTIKTRKGGTDDIGIKCIVDGVAEVFTRPMAEVSGWVAIDAVVEGEVFTLPLCAVAGLVAN